MPMQCERLNNESDLLVLGVVGRAEVPVLQLALQAVAQVGVRAIIRCWHAAAVRSFHEGVTSVTFGKYLLNRSWSRVAMFQPMISACAPMKKSGNGIFGGALPPESRRAAP